ncbi:MAG: hypothetical protein ACYDG2_03150 [Ruminiclostridium sp.]
MGKQANEMFERASASASYEEALNIIEEYVTFTGTKELEQSESEDEQFNMKFE